MKRAGFISESLLIAILGFLTSFYGGAVIEAETNGQVTETIKPIYDVNTSKCPQNEEP